MRLVVEFRHAYLEIELEKTKERKVKSGLACFHGVLAKEILITMTVDKLKWGLEERGYSLN